MNIEYVKQEDYLLPNLVIENQNYGEINRYGLLRLNYIKEHKKELYQTLLMKNELTSHLLSVGKECEERLKTLMDNYIKNDEKLSEKSKENSGLEWVKLMNNYKNTAEKIIRFVAISSKEKFPISIDNVKDKYGIISYKTNKLLEN